MSPSQDPDPARSQDRSRRRSRRETVVGHLGERSQVTRVRARDLGHLRRPLMRQVRRHTLALPRHHALGNPPRHLAHLIS
jgi:hypothetical protein